MVKNAIQLRDISPEHFPAADSMDERIKFLLKYAVLAPSTHNIQPWLFKVSNNVCELHLNPDLHLPEADKTKRNAYISLGCSLENLIIAAKYYGIYARHEYFNNIEQTLAAKIFFKENFQTREPGLEKLITAIKNRVNARGVFISKLIDKEILVELNSLNNNYKARADFITNEDKIEKIAKLTEKGMKQAHRNKRFRKEMSGWINHNFSKRRQGIPGYSMNMRLLFSFVLPKMMKTFNLGFLLGKLNYKSVASAPVICVISVAKESKEAWLETGRMAQAIMLRANISNLKTSIYIAAIEMDDLRKELVKVLATGMSPQFLFCIGKMSGKHKLTPRLSAEEKVIN